MMLIVLSQLLIQLADASINGQQREMGGVQTHGVYFDTKSQGVERFDCPPIESAKALLDTLIFIVC